MSSSREIARLRLARNVTSWLRLPVFRDQLVTAPDGSSPVVVCLPDDTVSYMFQLAAAAGGTASVLVPAADGHVVLVGVGPTHIETAVQDDDDCPLHPDTHVDMLLTYLKRRATTTHCRLVAPDYEFGPVRELTDQFV